MTANEKNNRVSRFCFEDIEISPQDITTVGKAFISCNPKDLLSVLLDTELRWEFTSDMLNSRSGATLIRRISSVLDVMNALYTQEKTSDVKESKDVSRSLSSLENLAYSDSPFSQDFIVVPHERFEALDGSGYLNRRVSAALINLGKTPGIRNEQSHHLKRACSVKQVKKAKEKSETDSFDSTWGWKALLKSLKPLCSESWPNILHLRIWLPHSLSSFERYCMLGSIFWAMTYRGFPDDSIQSLQVDQHSVYSGNNEDEQGSQKEDESCTPSFFCSDEQFYDEIFEEDKVLVRKMKDLVEMLNYNCWVNFIDSAFILSELGTAA